MKLVCALPPYTSFCRHCRHIRSNILCCSEPSTTGNLYTRVKSHCVPITRYYVNLTRRYVRYINSRELYSRIARTSRRSFLNKRRSGIRENDGGLNSGSKRTNPNIPYAAYSVGCFRLCNCDNILLPQPPPWYRRVLFPRGSSAWACNEPSWTKLSRRRASCRLPHICLYTCRHMWTVRVMHASPTEYVSPLNNVLAGYVSGGCRPSFARHPLQYGECWILDAISIELRGSDGEAFKLFLTNYHRTRAIFEFLKLLRRMWRWSRDVRWLLFEIFLKWKQDF